MTLFKEIRAAYLATDGFLLERRDRTTSASRKARWLKLRRYNDQAYFVMLFAQLELHIDTQCAALIARKKSSAKWKSRRLWDSVDVDRLTLMRKVALLTDKGHAVYAKIDSYYETRCKIAHGDSALVGSILLTAAARDLVEIAKALRAT